MSPAAELVLDREVRDWVLLPLTACVLLMQLLRQYVTQVRQGASDTALGASAAAATSPPPPLPPATHAVCRCLVTLLQLFSGPKMATADPAKVDEMRRKMALARSGLLRANAGWIPEGAFRQRKAFFVAKVGIKREAPERLRVSTPCAACCRGQRQPCTADTRLPDRGFAGFPRACKLHHTPGSLPSYMISPSNPCRRTRVCSTRRLRSRTCSR